MIISFYRVALNVPVDVVGAAIISLLVVLKVPEVVSAAEP